MWCVCYWVQWKTKIQWKDLEIRDGWGGLAALLSSVETAHPRSQTMQARRQREGRIKDPLILLSELSVKGGGSLVYVM